MTARRDKVRCAIYTRKSSEEGLGQEFNSLDAQREACEAYIASQKHEGWVLLKEHYDDGGLSGGTMDRPALQQLLEAVDDGLVDQIVVYKVDRLTRSLPDFSRLIERLDKAQASFVSVTQSFNTATSMGRLTLNVLLSFAQFEREVTAERTRDKIAASKRKGMWMGGPVPLGYDAKDRMLIAREDETSVVADEQASIQRRIERLNWKLAAQDDMIAMPVSVIDRIDLKPGYLTMRMDVVALARLLSINKAERIDPNVITISMPFEQRRRGMETRMVMGLTEPQVDTMLISNLAQARSWYAQLKTGSSLASIAQQDDTSVALVTRILPLAFLSPDIVEAICTGRQPPELTSRKLRDITIPMDWSEQASLFELS